MTEPLCYSCGTPDRFPEHPKTELRPYGPGGQWVCAGCGLGTPEATQRSQQAFGALSDATRAVGDPVIIHDSATPA